MAENLLEVIHVLEGLPRAEHWRMLNVDGLQSTKISDWQCKNWKLIRGFQKPLCLRFWRNILAWNMSGQNLFRGFCHQSRRNIVLQLLMTWFKLLPMNQICHPVTLAFPKTEIICEREKISDHWWDSGKSKGAANGDSNKGFCRVFWTVEEMLGELCEVQRYLLRRWLRCHCPMYNVSCILYLLQ